MSAHDIPTLVARVVAYPSTPHTPLSTIRQENTVFKRGSLCIAVMAQSSSESAIAIALANLETSSLRGGRSFDQYFRCFLERSLATCHGRRSLLFSPGSSESPSKAPTAP